MVNSKQGTEEKILEAAKKIFHRKGYKGARMQEIADEAAINKALLHYYFRSKEKLFEAVFEDAFSGIMHMTSAVFLSDKPLIEKIQAFLTSYINIITENSYIPWFIINGIYERPEQIKAIFDKQHINPPQLIEVLKSQIQSEYNSDINPIQIWLNVLSLSIFPVIAKPLLREIFQLPEEAYNQLMEERKELVPQLIINALNAYEKGENK